MTFTIERRSPTTEEYLELTSSVGWGSSINPDAVPLALSASLVAVVALAGERTVGTGRVVGDGAIYFYIQDVAVLPEFQGCGVGTAIVAELLTFVEAEAPEGAFVALFSSSGKADFYERFGFERRKADAPGMAQYKLGTFERPTRPR